MNFPCDSSYIQWEDTSCLQLLNEGLKSIEKEKVPRSAYGNVVIIYYITPMMCTCNSDIMLNFNRQIIETTSVPSFEASCVVSLFSGLI